MFEISNGVLTSFEPEPNETSIKIPDEVIEIESRIFRANDTIKEITLSNNMVKLSFDELLINFQSLEKLKISKSIIDIDTTYYCYDYKVLSKFVSIDVDEENPNYSSVDGVLYNKDKTTLLYVPNGMEHIKICDTVNTIKSRAFFKNQNLENIEIPSSVTTIERDAFNSCQKLKSIEIPSSVTELEPNVFRDCKELEEVKLPETLEKIGFEVFYGTKLKSIDIPSSVSSIECNAFLGCKELKSIEIPKNITKLESQLFYDCINLESVKLHDDIDEIERGVFSYCKSLKEIKIPPKITYISPCFIKDCVSIKEIEIPENVKKIDSDAFSGCEGLKTIYIPKSVEEIGGGAFEGCYSLESFTVDEDNPNYSAEDGVLYNKDKSLLYCIPRAKSGIFKMAENTENNRTYYYANEAIFENCKKLTKVIFSENFSNMVFSFQNFGAPNRRRSASERYSDNVYEVLNNMAASFYPFQLSSEMKKEIIGGVLKAISNKDLIDDKWKKDWLKYLKSQRKNLYSNFVENVDGLRVLLDEKIFNLDDFKNLIEIATEKSYLNVSSLLLEYQNRTFSVDEVIDSTTKDLCVDVNSVSYLKENWTFKKNDDGTMTIVNYKGNDIDIDVPEFVGKNKVVAIGEYAFSPKGKRISDEQKAFRHTIRKITIPDSIQDVSSFAFLDCESLAILNLPKSMKAIPNCVEVIKDGYFEREKKYSMLQGCNSIEEIVIPEGVTVLEERAFSHMKNLKKVTLPSTLENIKNYVFSGCENLEKVELPSSLKILGERAFLGCGNLKEINIPSSLKEISESAFYGCNSLTQINLPSSIEKLDNKCFSNCESLESITIPGTVSQIGSSAFELCLNLKTVIIQEGVTDIGRAAFYRCENLVDVTLPSTLKSIDSSVFTYCFNLKSIDLNSSLEILGDSSFSECKSLTNITIPESVKAINSFTFFKSGLESINILEGITEIGEKAFSECNLENVTLPHSVKTIKESAFKDCKKLKTINIFENLEELNSNAFYGCELLENINVDEKNANFSSIDGVLYNKEQTKIIIVPSQKKTIELPKSITILNSLIGANNIESIVIGENITEISEEAFYACKKLNKIVFENNSVKIQPNACIPIVALQNGISSIYPKQLHFEIRSNCYEAACTLLLDNNSSVSEEWRKEWSKYLKSNKKSLYDDMLNIPKLLEFMIKEVLLNAVDITELKKNASEQVLALLNEYEKANISEADKKSAKAKSEKKEDVNSIAYMKKIWNFKEEEDGTIQIINYKGSDENIIVPAVINDKPVTTIGYGAFSPVGKRIAKGQDEIRRSIKSIVIPDGVTEIGERAFFECESLESLTLPDSITKIGVDKDEGYFYPGCLNKYNGFLYGCKSLKSVTIPKKIESFPRYFLCNCEYIENITLPTGLKLIDKASFYNCTSLKNITIPEGVTSIEERVFCKCINLESVTLPQSLTEIKGHIFDNCKSLNNIVIPKNTTWNSATFRDCERLSSAVILSDKITFEDYSFQNCISLKHCELPKNTETIKFKMFEGCSNLESIDLPDSVNKISFGAFYDCTALKEITIGRNITDFTSSVFDGQDIVIHCEKGSAIEEYAKKKGISYDNNL